MQLLAEGQIGARLLEQQFSIESGRGSLRGIGHGKTGGWIEWEFGGHLSIAVQQTGSGKDDSIFRANRSFGQRPGLRNASISLEVA
jgi:hypothetical protein